MSTCDESLPAYDALLIVGFGGPEGPGDVIPFLENVLRGRNVPRERMIEVAAHYDHFGGVSPINGQVRDLIAVLRPELARRGIGLPVYWGNRNWHPMLADTMTTMAEAGVRRALAVVLAAYSSYSSCRQYREDIQRAREAVAGAGAIAPRVDKVRVFYNHPDFILANADRVRDALEEVPSDRRDSARVAFTAHSIPVAMAENCRYVEQLEETCRLVAEAVGVDPGRWKLVYQSRSGRPTDAWLEPDIVDHLRDLRAGGAVDLIIHPVGFLSDHMEVLYDLDDEAKVAGREVGLNVVRSGTVGIHPAFVSMLGDLIQERLEADPDRRAVGLFGPSHDVCPEDCCLPPAGRPRPQPATGG